MSALMLPTNAAAIVVTNNDLIGAETVQFSGRTLLILLPWEALVDFHGQAQFGEVARNL
jgi:hypothetical protein